MPPTFVLADLYAQASLHRYADSALPDAPVQPYVEPAKRVRRWTAALRRRIRRPTYAFVATSRRPASVSH